MCQELTPIVGVGESGQDVRNGRGRAQLADGQRGPQQAEQLDGQGFEARHAPLEDRPTHGGENFQFSVSKRKLIKTITVALLQNRNKPIYYLPSSIMAWSKEGHRSLIEATLLDKA